MCKILHNLNPARKPARSPPIRPASVIRIPIARQRLLSSRGRLNWWPRASLKSFTPSERVAIGLAVEAELGKRQGQRTDLAGGGLVQNFAQVEPGQKTRAIAADKAGFGNAETYRQAKAVVEQGSPELVAAMDSGAIAVSTAARAANCETIPCWVRRLAKSGTSLFCSKKWP